LRVFINEWMTRNTVGIRDPADNPPAADDWFELYNAEAYSVDLGGFYLTDNPGAPTKFRVPANGRYTVPAGGFLLVWADSQTNQNSATRADLHVNFQLSSSAGIIVLFAPDGQTAVDVIIYGQQNSDVSEGRYTDGASARYFMPLSTTNSTPRGPNSVPGYNTPPWFPSMANRVASPGQNLGFSARASDPDAPPQILTYSVAAGPADAEINVSGYFRWIVPTNQAPGDYEVTLRATDNGTPPRSGTRSFVVTVLSPGTITSPSGAPPVIRSVASANGQAPFTIDTIPGRTYRVFYTDNLETPAWSQLDRDFVAANSTASLTDFMTVPQRFYRVVRLE
jgi:hypothetical protein